MRSRLQLDFVAPPSRSRLAGIVVLAAAVGLAAHLVLNYRDTQDRLQQLEAVEAMISAPRPVRALPRERLEAEMKAAQATVRQLSLPWAQLIDSLERSAMREVAVLHVQPDAQQRLLRVTAETRGEELMLEYLRRVGASGFAEAHLVSHVVREDDPQRPLQFSLQASFRKP
jgi:hypothetical protein